MVGRQRALKLLNNIKNRNPIMLHGTSTSAVIKLFQTGRLPTAVLYGSDEDNILSKGYLFFRGIPRRFQRKGFWHFYHKLEDYNMSLDDLINESTASYAGAHQEVSFLKSFFNCPFKSAKKIFFEDIDFEQDGINEMQFYKHISNLEKEIKKCKGVVLGVNEKALKLDLEHGCDEYWTEVMTCLPKGLDIKYIDFIQPLGEIEKQELFDFAHTLPKGKW